MRGVEVRRNVRVPTAADGVTLSADVFLPATDDPVPAVLTVWPYRKDTGIGEPVLRWFAEQGYATVLVDARGTGSSDGEHRAPFDAGEADDAVDAIAWAAAQPWCDGNVGMWGHSYGAIMSLRAASRRPGALRAIVPFQCVADAGRELWHPDGARGGITLLSWGSLTLCQHLLPPLTEFDEDEERRWKQRLEVDTPWIVDLWRNGPDASVWRDRAIDLSAIDVPTLVIGGWRDLMCAGTVRAFEQITAPKRLVMGPWAHEMPLGDAGFLTLLLRWWQRWLRGIDNGVMDEPAVSLYVQGEQAGWRSDDSWPPAARPHVIATRFDAGDGSPAAGSVTRDDPTVGALSGSWWLGHPGHALDQHDDDMRALPLTSEPLDDDVLVAGRPEVTIRPFAAESSEASAERVVVRLADVDPDGRSTFVTSGTVVGVPLGEPIRVALVPTAYRFRAGHRVRVVVGDADFPRLWPVGRAVPFGVRDVEVVVPRIEEHPDRTGAEVPDESVPPPMPPGRRWSISRDPLQDDLEIVIGEFVSAPSPLGGHVVDLHQSVRAAVRRDGTAVMEAANDGIVRTGSLRTVDVAVSSAITADRLVVRATVAVDGDVALDRTWDVAAPPEGDT